MQRALALKARPHSLDAPGSIRLDAFLMRWLDTDARTRCKPRTLAERRRKVESRLIPHLAGLEVRELSADHVERLMAELEAAGDSAYTREAARGALLSAMQYAVRLKLIPANPVLSVPAPRRPKVAMRVWTPEEARLFLEVARGDRLYALYCVALMGGLRQGEILGLRWRDVDFGGSALSVQGSLDRDGVYDDPKTDTGRRRVDMPAEAMAALEELSRKGEYVFRAPNGGRLRPSNLLRRSFRPLLERAGLRKPGATKDSPAEERGIRFHDLRHAHATHLLLAGVHPKVVSERLGHASIEITLRIYSHVLPGLQRQAADKIGELLALPAKAAQVGAPIVPVAPIAASQNPTGGRLAVWRPKKRGL